MMSNQKSSDWNDERLALLRELNDHGSSSWIADEINQRTGSTFTRNAIIGKRIREGIDVPYYRRHIGRSPRFIDKRESGSLSRRNSINYRRIEQLARYANAEPAPTGIGIFDLQPDQCRYPYGDGPFVFCGHPSTEGSSYCAYHHQLCYTAKPERPLKRPLKHTQGKLSVPWGVI